MTPPELFKVLNEEFDFGVDAAASKENALCDVFITEEENALVTSWNFLGRSVFCNPPYSMLSAFVQRGYEQSQEHRITTVMLLPAYSDPKYWAGYVMKAHEVRFLKGRLAFIDQDGMKKTSARYPSVVVINKWIKGECFGKAPLQFVWDWRK